MILAPSFLPPTRSRGRNLQEAHLRRCAQPQASHSTPTARLEQACHARRGREHHRLLGGRRAGRRRLAHRLRRALPEDHLGPRRRPKHLLLIAAHLPQGLGPWPSRPWPRLIGRLPRIRPHGGHVREQLPDARLLGGVHHLVDELHGRAPGPPLVEQLHEEADGPAEAAAQQGGRGRRETSPPQRKDMTNH